MAKPDAERTPHTPNPGQTVMAVARAYRSSQLLYVAAKLKIADLVADGPKTCQEIAESLGASQDALCRVMRGLSMLGIFDLREDGRFALTELSKPLLSDVAGSVRPGVIYVGEEQYRAWGDLLHTVMTGEPAFPRLFGDPFTYYDQHPEAGETFDSWMTVSTKQASTGISYNYEFPESGTVVDVAGGEGFLLAAILKPRSQLHGILLERKSVIEKARRSLLAEGVLERCRLVAGDFLRAVPRGGDVYVLRNVLHDWDDSGAVRILSATRRAMKPSARLLVIQRAIRDRTPTDPFTREIVELDLMQLVYSGGRERSEEDYRALLKAAGFEVTLVMQSAGVAWLMEARPTKPPT
jgi:O-methyltransferase domain/Dimerisation domain